MEKQKRRRGDRRDGRLLRELDSLHFITGIIYPNRCDNEAYISERIDLTPVKEYIARRNETETDFPYTYFHLVLTALVKTITLRPKMNRFIVNGNFFQRNEVTASFVVKKQFSDKGAEALAMLHTTGDENMTTLDKIVFCADYVEEGRTTPGVEPIRKKILVDLDGAMLDILNATVNYLKSKNAEIDKRTLACRDWLEKTIRKGEQKC